MPLGRLNRNDLAATALHVGVMSHHPAENVALGILVF
jgi:hypothetical protein